MIQMSSSKFDALLCWGRTKRLQSLCSEILFDSSVCVQHQISVEYAHGLQKGVGFTRLSEFYDRFPIVVGAPGRGSSRTAMLSGILASLAFLNLSTHRNPVFAIARHVVPWS